MTQQIDPFSDGVREYYHSNPQGEMVLQTIELRHPAFVGPDNVTPAAIRFVNDSDPLDARLEADAPLDASELVTFSQGAFQITLPGSVDQGTPTAQIAVDNIGQVMMKPLANATSIPAPVELSFREFLLSDLTEPAVIVDGLTIGKVNASPTKLTAQAGFEDDGNVPFGRQLYTREEYPGLVR